MYIPNNRVQESRPLKKILDRNPVNELPCTRPGIPDNQILGIWNIAIAIFLYPPILPHLKYMLVILSPSNLSLPLICTTLAIRTYPNQEKNKIKGTNYLT